jgi:hypothetical protein
MCCELIPVLFALGPELVLEIELPIFMRKSQLSEVTNKIKAYHQADII